MKVNLSQCQSLEHATRASDNSVRLRLHAAPQLPAVFQAFYDLLMNTRSLMSKTWHVCHGYVCHLICTSRTINQVSIARLPTGGGGMSPSPPALAPGWIRHWCMTLTLVLNDSYWTHMERAVCVVDIVLPGIFHGEKLIDRKSVFQGHLAAVTHRQQVWRSPRVIIISKLPNLFIGTPRIYNFILLLIEWLRSFSTMLPSVKFAEDKVLVFFILCEKC